MVRKFFKHQEGVAAIEFALIMPILWSIIFVLWDLSSLSSEKMRLQQMVRVLSSNVVSEINNPGFNALNDSVINQFYPDPGEIKPTIEISSGCYCAGEPCENGYFNLCSDGSVPSRIITIDAKILVSSLFLEDMDAQTSLDIQIR